MAYIKSNLKMSYHRKIIEKDVFIEKVKNEEYSLIVIDGKEYVDLTGHYIQFPYVFITNGVQISSKVINMKYHKYVKWMDKFLDWRIDFSLPYTVHQNEFKMSYYKIISVDKVSKKELASIINIYGENYYIMNSHEFEGISDYLITDGFDIISRQGDRYIHELSRKQREYNDSIANNVGFKDAKELFQEWAEDIHYYKNYSINLKKLKNN